MKYEYLMGYNMDSVMDEVGEAAIEGWSLHSVLIDDRRSLYYAIVEMKVK